MLVVAGVIERDGRVLVCQRRADQRHPLQWEFPGGKVEAGEEPAAALGRELSEELGIEVTGADEIERYPYAYPGRSPITLVFWRVTCFRGEPGNLVFEKIVWERPTALPGYDFVEGDADFVRRLATSFSKDRSADCGRGSTAP